jgi:hypothetical protein
MKKYNSGIMAVAVLLCWVAVRVTALAHHEGRGRQKPTAQNNRQQPEMRRQGGQMEMYLTTMTLNNLLVMSYLQNMATYARLLRDQVQQCGSVDGDFARDVTAEIWRNFDQLDRYRRRQMAMTQGGMLTVAMGDHSSMAANAPSEYLALREIGAERGPLTPPSPAVQGNQMTDMMRRTEACLTRLSAHLVELERETGAASPNPKWVLEYTNAILRLLDGMSTTCGESHASGQND